MDEAKREELLTRATKIRKDRFGGTLDVSMQVHELEDLVIDLLEALGPESKQPFTPLQPRD